MTQALSPEWTPASSTCSITAPISTSPVRVADGVDVDLDGVLEEPVDQHRAAPPTARPPARASPNPASSSMARAQVLVVVDDLHGPAAEHVARPHQDRVADPADDGPGLLEGRGRPAGRLGDPSRAQRAFQRSRSSARSIDAGEVPRTRPGRQQAGQLQRGLAAEGDDHPGHRARSAASTSMTLQTSSPVTGSKYRRSLVS